MPGHQHQVARDDWQATDGIAVGVDLVAGDQRDELVGTPQGDVGVEVQVARGTDGDIAARGERAARFDVNVAVTKRHEAAGDGGELPRTVAHRVGVTETDGGRVGEDVEVGRAARCKARAGDGVGRAAVDAQIACGGRCRGGAVARIPAVARRRIITAARGEPIELGRRGLVAGAQRVELPRHVERRAAPGDRVAVVVGGERRIDGRRVDGQQGAGAGGRVRADGGVPGVAGGEARALGGVGQHRRARTRGVVPTDRV